MRLATRWVGEYGRRDGLTLASLSVAAGEYREYGRLTAVACVVRPLSFCNKARAATLERGDVGDVVRVCDVRSSLLAALAPYAPCLAARLYDEPVRPGPAVPVDESRGWMLRALNCEP
eukprot:SAG31_NODE_2437_length_5696_cov_2.259067_2_plen_118_part_00